MHSLHNIVSGIHSLLRRKKTEQELDEEVGAFLEMAVEEKMKSGMSREGALRAVRLEHGSRELSRELVHVSGWEFIVETLWQDLRFSLRTLLKHPGFTVIAVLTLAVGIGATTTIFSVVHAVLFTPLPYHDPGRLVVVYDREARATGLSKLLDLYQDFQEYRDHSQSFDRLAGMTWIAGNPALTGYGSSKEIHQVQTTVDFFPLLGVSPAIGRTFAPEDLERGCALILAYSFWKDTLGAQKSIIGKTIRLDDQACDVVGVMPNTFAFFPSDTEVWKLIGANNKLELDPRHSGVAIYGHLKLGASISAATTELLALHERVNEHDRHGDETLPIVLPLQQELTWLTGPNIRVSLYVLLGAVSVLLLIGCGNVANLLLTRSLSRQRELAIRSALGSGVSRLLRQLLTESLVLSLFSAALGFGLAGVVIRLFNILKPIELPATSIIRLNGPVLLFAVGLSVLTATFFGFVPAWKAAKVDLVEVLKTSGQSSTQSGGKRRIAKILIVTEVMLSLVLLAGAGLLIESAARFASIPIGFAPSRISALTISLPLKTYARDVDRARIYDEIFDSLDAIPGVQTASSSMLPFRPIQGFDALEIEGEPPSTSETAHHDAGTISISPGYFSTLGVPLLKGRAFDVDDRLESEAVTVVNEALVKKYFGTKEPLGLHVRSFGAPKHNPWRRIVGVVADEKRGNPFQEMSWMDTPVMFLPTAQTVPSRVTLLVRADIDQVGLANLVQRKISVLDPNIPVSNIQTVEHLLLKEHLSFPRFRAAVVASFAAFALLLAIIGLYGVLSQLVTQRTNEIGIRMALGADARNILGMITKEGLMLVSLGIILGVMLALILGRFLAGLLYGVRPNDPLTLAVVSGLLLVATLTATLVPAWRAIRVDPMVALRYE